MNTTTMASSSSISVSGFPINQAVVRDFLAVQDVLTEYATRLDAEMRHRLEMAVMVALLVYHAISDLFARFIVPVLLIWLLAGCREWFGCQECVQRLMILDCLFKLIELYFESLRENKWFSRAHVLIVVIELALILLGWWPSGVAAFVLGSWTICNFALLFGFFTAMMAICVTTGDYPVECRCAEFDALCSRNNPSTVPIPIPTRGTDTLEARD
jgi:hypothetical protein